MEQNDTQSHPIARPRPLIVTEHHSLALAGVFLEHILVGFTDELISAALLCDSQCDTRQFSSMPVEFIIHPAFRLRIFRRLNQIRLYTALERFGPNIVHCFGHKKLPLAMQIAEEYNIGCIATLLEKPSKHFYLLGRCDAIIAPCQNIAEYTGKKHRPLDGKIAVMPFGTFVEDSCCCFDRMDHVPSFVCVCSLDSISAIQPLLSAIRHLAIDGGDFVFVIMGSGSAEHKVRRMIRELGLGHIVSIVPRVTPIRPYLAGADIFVQLQQGDLFNPDVIEAVASGLAVATYGRGCDKMFVDGQTAVLFDHTDELSIYSALKRLLDHRDFAQNIAMNAQQQLRQFATVSQFVGELVGLYRKTIATDRTTVNQQTPV